MSNKKTYFEDQIFDEDEENYEAGFKDEDVSIFDTGKGLSKDIIKAISKAKNEPAWMLELRLKAYEAFLKLPLPEFGPNLELIDFSDFTYFIRNSLGAKKNWEEVPETIKDTFQKLGIPEAEQKFLAGVTAQYESEAIYHNMLKEVEDKGVIFLSTDQALAQYPELVKEYFGSVVPFLDNKFSALNVACWSGGSFIYVPKGVRLDKPLQSYFRINREKSGQFEHSIIIVDEDASVHYVEGCTAPIYSEDSLHAAVVEVIIKENGVCRYSTIQNWSKNIINLVTKRAVCYKNAKMEWIDGNIGSSLNMKYPACVLKEEGAVGRCISIAVASSGQFQDAGARMIHLAPNTSSTIISKTIVRNGGVSNYRGTVRILPNAANSRSHVECDTLIIDNKSHSDTIPDNDVRNGSSFVEHEASVSKINEDQLFFLMSRGLSEEDATQMIISGFLAPFANELPMEYAVELNQLLKLDMKGSVG